MNRAPTSAMAQTMIMAEYLDVQIDSRQQRLIVNPAAPYIPKKPLK